MTTSTECIDLIMIYKLYTNKMPRRRWRSLALNYSRKNWHIATSRYCTVLKYLPAVMTAACVEW